MKYRFKFLVFLPLENKNSASLCCWFLMPRLKIYFFFVATPGKWILHKYAQVIIRKTTSSPEYHDDGPATNTKLISPKTKAFHVLKTDQYISVKMITIFFYLHKFSWCSIDILNCMQIEQAMRKQKINKTFM